MEERSLLRSLKKMAKEKTQIDDLGDDVVQNILSRLPALSFASAAVVSRSWNSICNRILSSPKLSSAVSFNRSLEIAVNEVVDKVLSEPLRPHFALASIGPHFSLQGAFYLIDAKLGSTIPIIVNVSEGVIGKDVRTDQFVEVQWEITEEQEAHGAKLLEETVNRGIILTVGFLPGLTAQIVPLLFQHQGARSLLIDEFVIDIKKAATAVSDSSSPAGIILFSGQKTDMKHVLQKIEYAFPADTFVVGDGGSRFVYRSHNRINNTTLSSAAVALIFATDRNKPLGIGETRFHVMLSTGILPVGFTYKTFSVKCNKKSTWLTASRDTVREHLDGQAILEEIYDELGDRIPYPALYIGITKRRRCSVETERERRMQFLEFHEVLGGDEECLHVNSIGIKTVEPFRFYVSDPKSALSSCDKVSDDLSHLTLDSDKRKVFGGIIFSCCGRGESFFGRPGVDSAPFCNTFPGVTFGGIYCAGEIGRGKSSLYDRDNEDEIDLVCCSEHVYSAVYLVMSYCPPRLG